MKRIAVILTLGFVIAFSGTSQAGWHRGWGWHHCWAPPPVVVVHPCYHPVWIAPHWDWDWGCHRYVWVRGFWR